MARPSFAIVTVCGLAVALGAYTALWLPAELEARHGLSPDAAACVTDAECEALELVLVGTGCGPERLTLVAREEDEFGTDCRSIDAHYVRPLTEEER